MKSIKEELYHHCQQFVQDRVDRIEQRIINIQESLSSETKSTAGDKHETGRAMLQLEREKSGKQLAEAQKLQEILAKIDISTPSKHARLGSLIFTSQATYFLSISAGKIVINNTAYFAIAANSPIGKLLLGKTIGDHFNFNETNSSIKEIL